MGWQDAPEVKGGWQSAPEVAEGPKPPPVQAKVASATDKLRALGHGARSGATLGFADELGALVQAGSQASRRAADILVPKSLRKNLPETATTAEGVPMGLMDVYRQARGGNRAEAESVRQTAPGYFLAGEVAGGAALPIPGGAPKTLGQATKQGAALGAAYGLGSGSADLTKGDIGGAVVDTALGGVGGAAGGAAGHGLAALPGALRWLAGRKIANIDEKVAREAAKEAAEATRSARSGAGTAAQDAYRQRDILNELKDLVKLTPEQAATLQALNQELAEKAQEKLVSAAANKATAAEIFKKAMESESKRASELGSRKLSGQEFKNQVGARVMRYGLPAAGGAALGALGSDDPLVGGLGGLVIGGAGGHAYRPMLQSLVRMAKQPVVQRPIWKAVEAASGGVGKAAGKIPAAASRPLLPEFEQRLAAAVASGDEVRVKEILAELSEAP